MNYLILVVSICCYSIGFGQINIQWQNSYDNTAQIDQSVGIVVDNSGNSYVTGSSWNGTDYDMVTVKYDPNGVEAWVATYDGLNNFVDEATGIAIDKNGFIYVTGHSNTAGATDYDIVTIKYDPANGNELWSQEYTGTSNYDQSGAIATDTLGNIYVVGTLEAGAGDNDVVLLKYNSAGTLVWNDTYNNGITGIHFGRNLTVDPQGNVYVLAEVESNSNFQDVAVLKYLYTSTGNPTWTQTYDADGNSDQPEDIFVDGNGTVYVTGGAYTSNLASKQDYYTIKINGTNGAEIWSKLYNGDGDDTDIANSVIADDNNGFVYITGQSLGNGTAQDFATIAYDANGIQKWVYRYASPGTGYDVGAKLILSDMGDIYASGTSYLSASNNDYLTLKFDSLGNKLWETRFNGPASGADNAIDMWVDAGQNIYITGKSKAAATNFDYRTIKYCQLTTDAGVDTSICFGDAVQLNASGGSNFMWSVYQGNPITGANFSCTNCANPVASPDSTTIYVVSSESGSGCVDYDTVVVTINPLPGPSIYNDTPLDFCIGDSVILYTDPTSGYTWSTGSDSISTVAYTSGNYSLTVVDTMGCNNSTQVTVTAYSLPTISGGIDTSLCNGDTIQLMPNGGISYVWMDEPSMSDSTVMDPLVWPSSSITYTVIGTDVNGCSDTGYVDVVVHALPTPPNITIVGNDLLSSYTVGNQWILNGVDLAGETGFTVTPGDYGPNGNGYYWILYTDNNGCQSLSDSVLIDTLSLSEFDLGDEITAYPNPVQGELILNFESAKEISAIRVVSPNGSLVYNKQLDQQIIGHYRIDFADLPKGIYLVQIISTQGIAAKRIIKE
ncbi:MAG: SBBP repeat-containing protein [Crocinitomicaceae bacterium]|nr:SBBP repeat-containing protein [Crocinitomicaceae bacterium]